MTATLRSLPSDTLAADGWRVVPAWRVLTPLKRQGHPDEQVLSVYRDYGVLPKDSRDDNHNRTPENLDSYQLVERGDVVFNKMKAWSGSVGVSAHRGIVSPDYLVCSVDSTLVDSGFLHYLLRSKPMFEEYARRSLGIRLSQWRLYWEALSLIDFALPSLDVQPRVADFLTTETARVDTLIAKNNAVSQLLDERLLSAVVQTITAGSREGEIGIYGSDYWIGDVPAGWDVAPLGARYRSALGKMLNPKRSEGENKRPYLSNLNVRWDGFDVSDLRTMTFDNDEWERYGVEPGDLLVCEGGEVGRAAVWEDAHMRVYYQKALHRLRPIDDRQDLPRFLMYAFMAAAKTGVFEAGSNKATIDHLTGEKLAEHRFPFPPIETQRHIVDHLDHVTTMCRRLQSGVARQVDLLKERRQALITAAVTGQLDI